MAPTADNCTSQRKKALHGSEMKPPTVLHDNPGALRVVASHVKISRSRSCKDDAYLQNDDSALHDVHLQEKIRALCALCAQISKRDGI